MGPTSLSDEWEDEPMAAEHVDPPLVSAGRARARGGMSRAKQGTLERGHIRHRLIRDLAGGATQPELARRYDVTQQAISQFAQRHATAVAAVVADMANEYADLWITEKRARLAELQEQVDSVSATLADPERTARAGVQLAEMLRVVQTALRQAAEELGQIPGRVSVQHRGSLAVTLNGVELEALR